MRDTATQNNILHYKPCTFQGWLRGVFRYFAFPALLSVISSCAPMPENQPSRLGAWLVYWDSERGLAELDLHGEVLDRVSLFGYELDEEGGPKLAPGLDSVAPRFFELSKEKGFEPWVTLVNDVRLESETRLKDFEVLGRIFVDPQSRALHAVRVAEKIEREGFAGLDLDFERVPASQYENFHHYVDSLARELRRRGLGFQVILEPGAEPLPPGSASVIVMGYNLHYPGGPPGPRATPRFVASLAYVGRNNADEAPTLALALGGFVWPKEGRGYSADWEKAHDLASRGARKGRSLATDVPYAYLEDGSQIWYEDRQSLDAKWKAARKAGFQHLMLWKLGGNPPELFTQEFRN